MDLMNSFIAQELDGTAKANRDIVQSIVAKQAAETVIVKKDTAVSIGQAMNSDVAKSNLAVMECLERLLKQL